MKKFKLIHYRGPLLDYKKGEILSEMIAEGKNIFDVDYSPLISPIKPHYDRYLHISEKEHYIDYGSYSRFIYIKELENESN